MLSRTTTTQRFMGLFHLHLEEFMIHPNLTLISHCLLLLVRLTDRLLVDGGYPNRIAHVRSIVIFRLSGDWVILWGRATNEFLLSVCALMATFSQIIRFLALITRFWIYYIVLWWWLFYSNLFWSTPFPPRTTNIYLNCFSFFLNPYFVFRIAWLQRGWWFNDYLLSLLGFDHRHRLLRFTLRLENLLFPSHTRFKTSFFRPCWNYRLDFARRFDLILYFLLRITLDLFYF